MVNDEKPVTPDKFVGVKLIVVRVPPQVTPD
jgi:hypothetical protein